jgi:hypothetical protein
MRYSNQSTTTGHRWSRTGDAYGETDTDLRGESHLQADWIAPGASRSPSYALRPWRELLKPILDELKDKLESFEGEPSPEDHRWLRGQLRKLVDRLELK